MTLPGPGPSPSPDTEDGSPVALIIEPRRRPVGGGEVRRLLPYRRRRLIGPFVYLDLIGPDVLPAGTGIDVPPHPHIGLATVTFLFEGALVHRDSTGAVQRIEPGDVNWMHAGGGVVHSERSPEDQRRDATTISGVQLWVALPEEREDDEAFFEHHRADTLPTGRAGDADLQVLAGSIGDLTSPARVASPLFYASATLPTGGSLPLPAGEERGVLVLSGSCEVLDRAGRAATVAESHLAVLDESAETVRCEGPATLVLLGGDALGSRTIWWNFVASTLGRIDAAKRRWSVGDFPAVPGETELVPLPR